MDHTAKENEATTRATLEEAAAVFEDAMEDGEEGDVAEEGGVDYKADDQEERDTPLTTNAEPPHPDGPPINMVVDADNGFNNQNRMAMTWTVRHR